MFVHAEMEKKSKPDDSVNASYPLLGQALQMKNPLSVILKYCAVKEITVLNSVNIILKGFTDNSDSWKLEFNRIWTLRAQGRKMARKLFYEEFKPLSPKPTCTDCQGFIYDPHATGRTLCHWCEYEAGDPHAHTTWRSYDYRLLIKHLGLKQPTKEDITRDALAKLLREFKLLSDFWTPAAFVTHYH